MVGVLTLPETIHRRLDSVEEAGESRMTGQLSRPVWRGEENHPLMRWYPSYPMSLPGAPVATSASTLPGATW